MMTTRTGAGREAVAGDLGQRAVDVGDNAGK